MIWQQLGADQPLNALGDFDEEGDRSGHSISLNEDGKIMAIGEPKYRHESLLTGRVRVFEFKNNNWVQLGSDIIPHVDMNSIYPENPWHELAGWSVSLNKKGNNDCFFY